MFLISRVNCITSSLGGFACNLRTIQYQTSILLSERSNMRICGSSLAGTASLNAARDVDVNPFENTDHPCRGVLPTVICVTQCDQENLNLRKPGLTRAVEL